ncbi:MAG TPA: hypothetical protein VJ779_02730 [Acetobacteraceae bacterium]|nr:hypothetical protein [Acetobacteraceae bacterium]
MTTKVGLSRTELFAGLCILGFVNGITGRAHNAIVNHGPTAALLDTFGISAIVWVAFFACPALLLRAPRERLRRADLIVAACALAAFMLPITPLSWIALTGLALYLLRDRQPRSEAHCGAWILLAITGAMFWGRLLMLTFNGPILAADALLASWFAGTDHAGNTVRFADGEGYVWIAPPCSSLANASLAVLCWVLFMQFRGLKWSLGNVGWCLLACVAVTAINVTRIGLMVLHRDAFDVIHGPLGAAVASWLSMGVMLGIGMVGTRRGRLAHV